MADQQLQGSASALGAIVVSGDHFYRWAPEVVSCSRAVEVVPRSVADALAGALESLLDRLPERFKAEEFEWFTAACLADQALAAYRAGGNTNKGQQ